MSRRKTKKVAAKRQGNNPQVLLNKLEKDFQEAPKKLATLLSKNNQVLKNKEDKLKKTLAKQDTHSNTLVNRINKLEATNTKNAAKNKQLKTYKKSLEQNKKAQQDLQKQLREVVQILEVSVKKHDRIIALQKALAQFDKDWNKAAKTVKAKSAVVKVKPPVTQPDNVLTFNNANTPNEEVNFEEAAEKAS